MVICLSCGLDSDKLDPNYPTWMIRKAEDGTYHWKECHAVGGHLNACHSIYDIMEIKKQSILRCADCNQTFARSVPIPEHIFCPRCKSVNVDFIHAVLENGMEHHDRRERHYRKEE